MNKNDKTIPIRLGGLFDGKTRHQAGSVWDKDAIAPTIDTMMGGVQRTYNYRRKEGRNERRN